MAKTIKWTKKSAQRLHAKRRALERFGVELNGKDLKEIVKDITSGRARFIGKESNRVSRFIVNLKGELAVACYDRSRNEIATFLTLAMAEENPIPGSS